MVHRVAVQIFLRFQEMKKDKNTGSALDKGQEWRDQGNVKLFIGFHRSVAFYDGDYLRVGDPNSKEQADPSDAPNSAPPSR